MPTGKALVAAVGSVLCVAGISGAGLHLLAQRHQLAVVASLVAVAGALALCGWLMRTSARGRQAAELLAVEERVLCASATRLQALVENASDTLAVVDECGTVRNLAGAAEELLGPQWRSLRGRDVADLAHPDDRAVILSLLADTAREYGKERIAESRFGSDEIRWRHAEIVARNLLDVEHVRGIVLTIRDVTRWRELQDQLRHRAFHDALTQLPNRALFYDRVEHALATEGSTHPVTALLFVDVDDFKNINDKLGHTKGDEVLVKVASRLTSAIRPADTAARLGGDEFGILLEAVETPDEVVEIARRVLDALREPLVLPGDAVTISASAGIALSADSDGTVETLLRNADVAMYAAKRNGKARFELFDPKLRLLEVMLPGPAEADAGRMRWIRSTEQEREVLAVLDQEEAIETLFQPIVDIRTGSAAGYEALSRFHAEPSRPPNQWFAIAHHCGLGARLEARAIEAALRAARDRPPGTYVSVNVSPSALLSEAVQSVLPHDLTGVVLEITENETVSGGNDLPSALVNARDRDARLACDDAGAGYAGLRQLMRLRPDMIKLDRSLVDGVQVDPAKTALVGSMVHYARDIGASVCAEGIESLEDLRALADLDVTYGQGYALARPGPPWPSVSPDALMICSASLGALIRNEEAASRRSESSDQRLEQIARRLFESERLADLGEVMPLIAAELRADEVACQVLVDAHLETIATHGWQQTGERYILADHPASRNALLSGAALQVLLSDHDADGTELERMAANGIRSLIKVPIVFRSAPAGMLEAWSHAERPWTRSEIHRARLVAHQLGAVLAALAPRPGDATEPGLAAASTPPTGFAAILAGRTVTTQRR